MLSFQKLAQLVLCPHNKQSLFSPVSINWLVFATEALCILCELEFTLFYIIFKSQTDIGGCHSEDPEHSNRLRSYAVTTSYRNVKGSDCLPLHEQALNKRLQSSLSKV